ncbi:MAG: fumarate hydratase C-terminal domain-containing protein, partial [Slackia sp.]|nr:fumarate hydratase C-terminal domain-containing protein [Slackia sp.]
MTDVRHIETPLTDDVVRSLHCGDMVSISGVIYTGRDAAHKIMCERIARGESLPVDFHGQVIYYA